MRTTLDIDDDVLQAAKERARRERLTTGQVISALARQAMLIPPADHTGATPSVAEPAPIYGFRPLARRGGLVTNELIDRLREDDAY